MDITGCLEKTLSKLVWEKRMQRKEEDRGGWFSFATPEGNGERGGGGGGGGGGTTNKSLVVLTQ